MRILFAVLFCALLWLAWQRLSLTTTVVTPVAGPAVTPPTGATASPPQAEDPTRTSQAAPRFEVCDDDGKALPMVARDGLVLRFLRDDGSPLGGQRVHVHWRKGWGKYGSDRGLTEPSGRFASTIPELPMLEWVEVPDHEGREFTGYGAFDQDAQGEVQVRLPRLVELQLHVQDLAGAPVQGVECKFKPLQTLNPPRVCILDDATLRARSDQGGQVRLQVPAAIYDLSFKAHGALEVLHESRIFADAAQDTYKVPVFLHRRGTGRRLRVHLGLPPGVVGPARVLAKGISLPHPEPPPWLEYRYDFKARAARSADGQHFEFADLPRTRARLTAFHDACRTAREVVDASTTELRIDLQPRPGKAKPADDKVYIRGVLLDAAGSPLSSRRLRLLRNDRILWGPSDDTDHQGRFEIGVPPGRPGVLIAVDGARHAYFGPYPLDEDPEPLRLQMPVHDGSIAGRVVDAAGKPVAAMVQVYGVRGPLARLDGSDPQDFLTHCPQEQMRSSDKETGAFTMSGLPREGRFCLIAEPWEGSLPRGRIIARAGAKGVELVLGEGFVDDAQALGTVRDARSREPIAGVTIRGTRESKGGRSLGELETRSDGSYHMVGGTPGVYSFYLHRRGYAAMEFADRRLAVGENRLDFRLWPATIVYLQLVDPGGTPLRRIEVGAFDAASGEPLIYQDEQQRPDPGQYPASDLAGRVDLRGLPQTRVRLVFRAPVAEGQDEAQARTVTRTLDLRRPATELQRIELAF